MSVENETLEAKAAELLREWALTLPPRRRADLLLESVRAIYFASMGGTLGGPYINPERDGISPVLNAALVHHEAAHAGRLDPLDAEDSLRAPSGPVAPG